MNARALVNAGLLVALSTTTASFGQIVGLGYGGGIAVETSHNMNPGSNAYFIDGVFTFSPGEGSWVKNLNAPAGGWLPGQTYAMHERITFLPDPTGVPSQPLTDWHERIELGSDGLIWDVWVDGSPMLSVNGQPISGLSTMFDPSLTEVWFLFDPIDIGPNGITLEIWKEFRFVGMQPMFNPVRVYEYPTPTPGVLATLGLAGLAVSRRRR